MLEAEATFVRSDEPIVSLVDNEVVMLSVRESAYFSFNEVASDIWGLLATPIRFDAICRDLASRYEVEEATLAAEVSAFLLSLLDRGLASRIGDTSSDR